MDIQVTHVSVNRRGQPQRESRRLAGPSLQVGRGTQCQINLPDPRVALQHARIEVSETGAAIDAEPGRLVVNGRAVDGVRLVVGDRIEVGPYLLAVEAPPAGVAFALSVTLDRRSMPVPASWGFRLRMPRVSKRRLSYLAFFATLLLCLLVPLGPDLLGYGADVGVGQSASEQQNIVRALSTQFVQAWNPGPVSRSHQPFGADCRACHALPFVQVRDQSCVSCHKTVREHVPRAEFDGPRGAEFRDARCADCHRDHKGLQMAPRSQDECAACHRDVKAWASGAQSEKVTDFRRDHPQFRLSLLDADRPDVIRRLRQGTPEAQGLIERSNLKFNHKLHLDPRGVRDPDGKRDAGGMFDAQGQRTVLHCADCHQPADGGRLMAPVNMEEHCQRCHSLAFEPKVTQRQVVHGDAAQMATMLREFYARLVLGDVPPDVNAPADLPRMRPGAVSGYQERQQALRLAEQKADLVLRELFETRKVCSTCHSVSRSAAGWQVAPVRFTRIWMPQAVFTHAKHSTERCARCHDVEGSKDARTVAMPDIAVCRECHVGAVAVSGRVTSDCNSCHKFHAGRDYWHGLMQTQMSRSGAK